MTAAAEHPGRTVHLRLLDPDLGVRAVRPGRCPGPQCDDAPLHHPGGRPRPAPWCRAICGRPRRLSGHPGGGASGMWSSPRARSGLATAVILGVARAIGEASAGAAHRRLHQLRQRQPATRAHGVAAPGDTEAGPGGNTGLHQPGVRGRLLPTGRGHRPVPGGPQDRGLGPRSPHPPGPAAGPRRRRLETWPGSPRSDGVSTPGWSRRRRPCPRLHRRTADVDVRLEGHGWVAALGDCRGNGPWWPW